MKAKFPFFDKSVTITLSPEEASIITGILGRNYGNYGLNRMAYNLYDKFWSLRDPAYHDSSSVRWTNESLQFETDKWTIIGNEKYLDFEIVIAE